MAMRLPWAFQWLRLYCCTVGIPGWGTKLPYSMAKKKKKLPEWNHVPFSRQGSGLGALQAGGQPQKTARIMATQNTVADRWGCSAKFSRDCIYIVLFLRNWLLKHRFLNAEYTELRLPVRLYKNDKLTSPKLYQFYTGKDSESCARIN